MFYEDLLQKFGSCGITLAVGDINRAKSKSVELSLSAIGCRGAIYTSISDALLRKLLMGAMPWCYDDPEEASQLEKMLISVFGGGQYWEHVKSWSYQGSTNHHSKLLHFG